MVSYRPDRASGFPPHVPHLEHLVQDPSFAVASLDHYVLLVWRREVSVAGALAVDDALRRVRALRPGIRLGFITLIEDQCAPRAPAELRQQMTATLKTHGHTIGAASIIYELEGF